MSSGCSSGAGGRSYPCLTDGSKTPTFTRELLLLVGAREACQASRHRTASLALGAACSGKGKDAERCPASLSSCLALVLSEELVAL